VNPRYVGRRIDVRVDLQWVVATCGDVEVARHRRFYGRHRTFLDAAHAITLRQMRAEVAGTSAFEATVQERDLADYDKALGVA
jgi:hypothetical protein